MDTQVRTIDLPNRILSYREYGDAEGTPLLYFHGYPSSSLEASYIDEAARQRGLRVVAPDRPGMGDSSMSPNRQITQWPHDVGTLINRLGIKRFAVLGLSAGAPYAWVCGNTMSKRVSAIGVVSGVVPGTNRLTATAKAFATLVRLPFAKSRFATPEKAELTWQKYFAQACERERVASHDPAFRAAMLEAIGYAFNEGSGGAAKDFALVTGASWGFAMGNVTVDRCLVWHGDADTTVPVASVRRLVERLPHHEMTVLAQEGHFSAWVNHHEAILDQLAQAARS